MTASLKLTRTHTFRFVTTDPATGAARNADTTPVVRVYRENSDTPILTPSVANVATGHYRCDLAITTGNGFEAGMFYSVVASATVAGVAGSGVIAQFQVVTRDEDDLGTLANQNTIIGFVDDLESRLTASRAAALDNLDAAISTRAAPGASMALTPEAIDAILDDVVEGALTLRQTVRIILAAVAGRSTGGGVNYRDVANTKDRIAATVDEMGNRTAVVLDGS